MALAGIMELRRRRHGTCNSWMDTARTFVPYLNMLGRGSVRFPTSPYITTINAIKTIWLCEEDPSHWIIMTPTFRLPKAILREEEFLKGIRLQEEPREEAPPKEEEEMPLKGEMLPKEEEIKLEFLEMF